MLRTGLGLALLLAMGCSTPTNPSAGGGNSLPDVSGAFADLASTADTGAVPDAAPDTVPDAGPEVVADVPPDAVAETAGDTVAGMDTVADQTQADDSLPADAQPADTELADATPPADVAPTDAAPPDAESKDVDNADVGPDAVADVAADVAPIGPIFAPLGKDLKLNANADGTVNPFVNPARNGQFYVSWVQKPGDLKLAWVNPDATVAEGPFTVNQTPGEVYYWGGQSVISDPDGNFFAVWEGKSKPMFAASTTGKTFGAAVAVSSTSENGLYPFIVAPKPGIVHLVWTGLGGGQYDPYWSSNPGVFTGGKWSAGKQVFASKVQDDSVAVAVAPDGTIHVIWETFEGDLFASNSKDFGSTFSPPVQINDVTGKASVGIGTFAAVGPDGKVWVAWSDTRTDSEGDLYIDVSADGTAFGADMLAADSTKRYQEDPSLWVAQGGPCEGTVYAVWQDFRNNKNYDIVGTRSVTKAGNVSWAPNQVVTASAAGDQMNPSLAVDGVCQVGVAWRDSASNPSFDIKATFFKWQ